MAVREVRRLAVGTPAGRRSTVWTFSVHKSEIYILSRMFGSDTKVSLHSSGNCQCSGSGDWVKKVPGRRNADRHFEKWFTPRPDGTAALHVFQIRIPETELRLVDIAEDLNSVQWLSAPPRGHTVSLECYITPSSQSDPALTNTLPYPNLLSLPLADGRWFIVLNHVPSLDGKDLESLRNQMDARARSAGIEPKPEHRGCAFTVSDGTARGFIELCTVGA
jgi:hypothetical protein